jgi:hypothetical protein
MLVTLGDPISRKTLDQMRGTDFTELLSTPIV